MNDVSARRRVYSDSREEYVEEYLNEHYPGAERVVFKDSNGKTKPQTIRVRDHGVRCPDIAVYEKPQTKTLLMRVEVKSFVEFRTNFPRNLFSEFENFLIIEKVAFDQYLELQAYEEIECRVVFVLGKNRSNYECFWLTLDEMDKFKSREFEYEGYGGVLCYAWNSKRFNRGLNGL